MNKKLERKHKRQYPNKHFKIGDRVKHAHPNTFTMFFVEIKIKANFSYDDIKNKTYYVSKITYTKYKDKIYQILHFPGNTNHIFYNFDIPKNSSILFEYPRKQKIQNLLQYL